MHLDCNTSNGRRFIAYQHECLAAFCKSKKVSCITTNDTLSADIDAIFYRDSVLAVGECKTRQLTLKQLKQFGSYLVSYSKIEKLVSVSKSLQCSGLLIVYLIPDTTIVWCKVCDTQGKILVDISRKTTTTQATCNGGTAVRDNAYIPVSDMLVI